MSSLTSSLLGRRKPVHEFTATGGVPTVDGAGPALNVKPKPQLRAKDPKDKKKLKEGDEDDTIIPDDAEEVATTGTPDAPTEIGAAETGLTGVVGEKEGGQTNPNLLTTALALVAPDCTPGWDKMLSPTALPKSEKRPVSAPPQEPSAEAPKPAGGDSSVSGMLKLTRSTPGGGTDQNLESQAKNLVASVITETGSSGSVPSGDALLAQGKPMPDPVQSHSSSGVLKRFHFGK